MSCEKISYNSQKDAKDHITSLVQRKGGNYSTYRCDDCGKHHVTSVKSVLKKTKWKEKREPMPAPNEFKQKNIHGPVKRSVILKSVQTTYKPFEYLKYKPQ